MRQILCLLLIGTQSLFAQTSEDLVRLTISLPKNSQRNLVIIPQEQLEFLCGDEDGCTIRLSMNNYGNGASISAPASVSSLLYLNVASKQWRTSEPTTTRGTFGNSSIEHAMQLFNTCYLTDGYYKGSTPTGDQGLGLSLMYWPLSERAGCSVTLID